MKRRLLCVLTALCLLLVWVPRAAAAADEDLVFEQDTVFKVSGYFIAYRSVTVKAGVTVTVDKDFGFEIMDRLTVEPGGRFICSGEGKAAFNFAMKNPGSEVTGVDLYYPQKQDDGSVTYELIPEPFADTWTKSDAWGEMNPQFKWNDACGDSGGWCLIWAMGGNPFGVRQYHTGRDMDTAEAAANRLRSFGLFRGVGDKPDGTPDYDLARKATRAEGLVMLLRMLGKEEEALGENRGNPFTDSCWADAYIGYAYETGLTLGRGDGTFGWNDRITAQQYLTFLLRALGYPEEDGALYRNALETAGALGLRYSGEDDYELCIREFWRADMVVATLRALSANCYDGTPLADVLGIQLIGPGSD